MAAEESIESPREWTLETEERGRRLRLLNWIAAVAFTIGGSLFALGAAVAQVGSGSASASASIYLVGGVFFSTGGYASLLLVINGRSPDGGWRWWSYEPVRKEWLAAALLFAGTLVFGVNLIDSFLKGLTIKQENRLIWAPDLIGCALFLASGRVSMVRVGHGRFRFLPRRLDWWIVAMNQLGSILFFISALAAFVRPATGSAVNIDVANWGTFGGAACFAVGAILQAFQRPEVPADVGDREVGVA